MNQSSCCFNLFEKMSVQVALILLLLFAGVNQAVAGRIISGAGATFPYPVYSQWAYEYARNTGVRLNYQSIGSGGGIRQIKAGTVDFGASDAPLAADDLKKSGLIQFPMIMGGVVPVVNLRGIKNAQLRLDQECIVGIFMGKIKKWNDPRIRALNPGLNLPPWDITVVHRSDGSGTTWIFSHYLAAVSDEWKTKVGAGKALRWPVGLGGKGNEGVAAYVKRVKGAIGYVEFAYALQNKLTAVCLRNRDGNFVAPTLESFQTAAREADWANTPGMAVVLVNQPGAQAWPITGASFILLHREEKDCGNIVEILKFFDWCYRSGGKMAVRLLYVPIPENVYNVVEKRWATDITCNGAPVWPVH